MSIMNTEILIAILTPIFILGFLTIAYLKNKK